MVLIAPKTTHSRIAHRHRKHQAFRTGTDKRKTWCLFGVLIGKTRGYEPIRCTVSDTTKPHETGVFQRYSTMPLSRITARERVRQIHTGIARVHKARSPFLPPAPSHKADSLRRI